MQNKTRKSRSIISGIERGLSLLVATTNGPLRLVNVICIFGALANLIYSFYVVYIHVTKVDVAPGWVSLSLQLAGMFFLFSIVLFFLSEYVLNMARLSSEGPEFHIAQDFISARILQSERLNVIDEKA